MGKQQMKTPGAPGATKSGGKRSPLAPTQESATPQDMSMDDISSKDVYAAGVRAKVSTISGNDSALGVKGPRGRTATNASAQFRITATKNPATEPPYAGTMSSARVLPAVMGAKQFANFEGDRQFSTGI